MMCVWILLLICLDGQTDAGCCAGQDHPDGQVYATFGESYTFKPAVEPEEGLLFIDWSFKSEDELIRIVSVVVPNLEIIGDDYKGRVTVNKTNGILTLGPLKSTDSGDYAVSMVSKKGVKLAEETHLRVLALQAEPTHNITEVEPFLITASHNNLMKINVDGSSSTVLKKDLNTVTALDFDFHQNTIYWIERHPDRIRRMHISGSDVQVLHNTSLSSPVGLAVDWVGGNLYWSDRGRDTIEVSKLNGSHRTVLVDTGLDMPVSMAVDVRYGYLYWSDISNKKPHIGRIGMDGTNRSIIVDKIIKPYGLTLDYVNDHIYWTNEGKYIEFANLDGTNRQTVVSQDNIAFLTLFEDHIYWTDMETSSIYRANKTQGTNKIRLISNLYPSDIHMYHPYRQPMVSGHPCQTNNGGCSHLCLLSPGGGYKCACPTYFYLTADNKQCISSCTASQFACKNYKCIPFSWKCDTVDDCGDWSDEPRDCSVQAEQTHTTTEVEPFLIVATRYDLMKINLNGSSSTVLKLHLKYAVALDFDYQHQMIYWIEWNPSTISRMHISGSDVQVLHNTSLSGPVGLAVDWVGGNLYWCNRGRATIEVSKLNGSHRTVLVDTGLGEPRSMAVDVRYGYLYWSDNSDNNPHIGRIGMDGTSRSIIVKDKISKPYGLTLDYLNDHIYWTNERKYIEFANLDGTNRYTIVSQYNIGYITLFEDHIYWTDMETRSIYRANKTQGTNKIRLISKLHTLDIHVYHPHRQPEVFGHPCQTNNGGCSHLCLLSPGGGYKCASPPTST